MFYPNKQKFIQLAQKGNLIPVYHEYFSDLDTPVSAFMKIADSEYSFILESAEAGRHMGRYSFLGSEPSLIFSFHLNKIKIEVKNKRFLSHRSGFENQEYRIDEGKDPLDEIKKILSKFKFVKDSTMNLPRFLGGFVGYIGYDVVDFFEPVLPFKKDDLKLPDILMMLVDNLIIFDHLTKKLKLVCNAYVDDKNKKRLSEIYDDTIKRLEIMIHKISSPLDKTADLFFESFYENSKSNIDIKYSEDKENFINKVIEIKKDIKEGEIIQAVLSQRLSVSFKSNPLTLYRVLRAINPSPYMFLLNLKDMHLIGSSPEVMVRCEDRKVELRPIAGTRPRGKDDEEDVILENELLSDEKEKAEHIMLVDLGRNDLGRVCEYNSVKVPEIMTVEKYSHVLHLVSSVVGHLKKDKDIFDLFRACFPAGTVTGAPKVRAMQVIREKEEIKRGPYAGCVGYFSFSKNMDTCITIRTIIAKDGVAYVQAGAGIVADSIPEKEYEETLNKAKALIKAIQIANQDAGYKLQDTGQSESS